MVILVQRGSETAEIQDSELPNWVAAGYTRVNWETLAKGTQDQLRFMGYKPEAEAKAQSEADAKAKAEAEAKAKQKS